MVLGIILSILAEFSAAIEALQEDERFHLQRLQEPNELLARAANDLVLCFLRLRKRRRPERLKMKSPKKRDLFPGVWNVLGPGEKTKKVQGQ